jgi:hypothetical protein
MKVSIGIRGTSGKYPAGYDHGNALDLIGSRVSRGWMFADTKASIDTLVSDMLTSFRIVLISGLPLPRDRATRRGIQAGIQHRQVHESLARAEHEVFPEPQVARVKP